METSMAWTENVIVADADYVDGVAFDLTVNFERMLGRRVPKADLAQWAECVALDGGLSLSDGDSAPAQEVQVVLIHDRQNDGLKNFVPSRFAGEIDGMACRGRVGELAFTAVQTEPMATKDALLADTLHLVCTQPGVRRLMVVAPEALMDTVRRTLRQHDSDTRRTTVLAMQPVEGGAFRQEMLGFSLMAALGISSREIEERLNAGKEHVNY